MITGIVVVAAMALLVALGPKYCGRRRSTATGQHRAGHPDGTASSTREGGPGEEPHGPRIVLAVGVVALLAFVVCVASLPLGGYLY
ncbi:hypothetical protein [Streptomyces sp. MNP-20]|uniref:hypothetical protein n=1 Tax=Streptomyces sp. MNP-20 TaxID=2721165 RepID=UPI001552DE32|nr:hypothetical protein [Streptomyces sp. MNP-20]